MNANEVDRIIKSYKIFLVNAALEGMPYQDQIIRSNGESND